MTSLWDALASASWVANTGIPLFLTISAIFVGFWTVRRQMDHDRMLLVAQNRARAAHDLGAAIQEEMEFFGNGLGNDSPEWKHKEYQGKAKVRRALSVAGGVLGGLPGWHDANPDNHWTRVTAATDVLDHVWQYAARRRTRAARKWGLNTVQINDAINLFLFPFSHHIGRIAESYLRWDGIGPLPAEPAWDSEPPVTGVVFASRHKPKGFWTAERVNEYRAGEARDVDPEWYAELDASWESCLECMRDIYYGDGEESDESEQEQTV